MLVDLYTNCLFLFIANIILVFLINFQNKKHKGIVDLVFFDGASNVQNSEKKIQARHPRITVGHGAEHVVSLFFADVFTKIPAFEVLANFAKKLRDVLDPQGMSSLPYSTIIPKSTTRASVLSLSSHLTAGWLFIRLLC